MKKIYIGHHFFGAGNIGDDLMLAGFLSAVRGKLHHISLTCSIPHHLDSQRRRFPEIAWIPYEENLRRQTLAGCDVWLGLGGSPFQSDDSEWFTEHLLQELSYCQEFGIPMYFLGVGVNNAAVLQREEIQKIINSAERIWARDKRSFQLIQSNAAKPDNVKLGADLAHCLLATMSNPANSKNSRCSPKAQLALCLNFQNDLSLYKEGLETLLRKSQAYEIHWLVQEVRELPHGERAMYRQLVQDGRFQPTTEIPDYESGSLPELLRTFPAADFCLSSRYHSAIFQAWRGAQLAIFAINDKLRGIAEELAVPMYTDLQSLEPENAEAFRSVSPRLLQDLSIRGYGSVIDFLSTIRSEDGISVPDLGRAHSIPNHAKILLLSPDSLGDLILRQSFCRTLLDRGFSVTVASTRSGQHLLPMLDPRLSGLCIDINPYSIPNQDSDTYVQKLRDFINRVKREHFDLIICPNFNHTILDEAITRQLPDIPAIRLSPGVESAISYTKLFSEDSHPSDRNTHFVSVDKSWHEIRKLNEILRVGFGVQEDLCAPQLKPSEEGLLQARTLILERGLPWGYYLLSCPLGTVNVSCKAVPQRITHTASQMFYTRRGIPTLFVGVESERTELLKIQERCRTSGIPTAIWIGDEQTLPCLVGLLSKAFAYFGGDTGPMHMAAALNIPIYTVMGGGTYPRFLPVAEKSHVYVNQLECFGCDWSCIFPEPLCLSRLQEHRIGEEIERQLRSTPRQSIQDRFHTPREG